VVKSTELKRAERAAPTTAPPAGLGPELCGWGSGKYTFLLLVKSNAVKEAGGRGINFCIRLKLAIRVVMDHPISRLKEEKPWPVKL